MSSDDGDPLDWTVDQVVTCLCYNTRTPWSQSSTQSPRPDPVSFEAALRQHLINGETLLNDVDKEALRQELGLSVLGHRSFVLAAIRYLRQVSVKYQRANLLRNPGVDEQSHAVSPSYVSSTASVLALESPGHLPYSPLSAVDTPRQRVAQSPALTTVPAFSVRHIDAGVNAVQQSSGKSPNSNSDRASSETTTRLENAADDDGTKEANRPHKRTLSQQPEGHDTVFRAPHLRPQEHYLIGKDGKKRRRLELRSGAQTTISSIPVTENHLSPVQRNPKNWYIGQNKVTPDKLFYPILPDQETEESSFVIVSPGFPRGHQLFVKDCLHHFYRQQPVNMGGERGNQKWAVVPYKRSMLEGQPQYFTLYSSQNGRITVTQADTAQWPQLSHKGDSEVDSHTGHVKPRDPYEYLLQKYPVKDGDEDTHPPYGDSGSEGEYDEDTWREMEDERQEPAHGKARYLTLYEVDSVIEQCAKDYEDNWRNNHLPKEERKARKIWLLARKGSSRNQQTKAILRDIDLLEDRLRKIQREIRLNEYVKVQDLQFQCQSMEQTVLNIQAQKWRILVLERENCPPRVSFAPPKPKPVPKKSSHIDEESLASESEEVSDGSLDDFIDYELDENPQEHRGDDLMEIDDAQERPRPVAASDTQPEPSSESEYDAISPSGKKRNLHSERPQRARRNISTAEGVVPIHQPPSPEIAVSGQGIECIDLTRSSTSEVDDFDVTTPPLNPVQPSDNKTGQSPVKPERLYSASPTPLRLDDERGKSISSPKVRDQFREKHSLPSVGDFRGIQRMDWDPLEERHDRHRLLTKLVASLPDEVRDQMLESIPAYHVPELERRTRKALSRMLSHGRELRDLSAVENGVIMRTASLYISWVNCVRLSREGIPKRHVKKAIADAGGFRIFAAELTTRLKDYYKMLGGKSHRKTNLTADDTIPFVEGSEENLQEASTLTPHKKRKREVKERQEVKQNQESAQLRVAIQEKQRKRLEQKMESIGVGNDDPTRQAVTFEKPVIYLDPHIGQRVKPHQLKGVQFMWRELIQDEKRQGCLLAHTMGLGKTMQVISLLVTISAAAASTDPAVRDQIPPCFHRSQTLILCPSSLIENWFDEFLMWTPRKNHLGPLRKITSPSSFGERMRELSAWDEEGGVLIMSYDIFRTWINNKETKARGRPLEVEDHMRIREQLLDGPNIIVADEAHKMKNRTAGISAAASEFRSKSRIALTGSPLANNLVDYYAMVDWIAPGYLGNFVEFKANYVEPIEEGLYVDSSYAERRRSLKKLQVLKDNLNPKINRADISVLEGSLPPKVEFVITVPLTDLQKEAYDMYVNSVLGGRAEVGNARLWSWLAILSLCCNHPACFSDKLLNQSDRGRKVGKKSDDFDSEEIPGDESPIQAGLPETMIASQRKLLASVPDLKVPGLSHRAQILDRIICESIKVGDKVLVFSHSLPSLDYIEHILKVSKRRYLRLDGHTPIFSRQAATKGFNQSGSVQQVYLISTRAGGLGLNIPGANRVVIFDFSFSPTWEEQAVGRAYRLGQQKPVFVYRFIAGGTFEEVMYNKAVFKTQLSFRVVDKKNPIRWASKSAREYLFASKSVETEDVSEYIGKDPHVLDKILRDDEHRTIRKIALTETFQKEDNDKLTEEEAKDVQEELDDEILKRNDPTAYYKKLQERQEAELALRLPTSGWAGVAPYSPPLYFPLNPFAPESSIPKNAHNIGPPPLGPDMSILRGPSTTLAADHFANTSSIPPVDNNTPESRPEDASALVLSATYSMSNSNIVGLATQMRYAKTLARQDNCSHNEHPQEQDPFTEAGPEDATNSRRSSKSSTPQSSVQAGKSGCKQQ